MKIDNGLFLTLDGVPRSGRTHQATALVASLKADGHDAALVSLPTDGTPVAKTTLSWLYGRLDAYLSTVEREVRPRLEAGGIVVLDGGITSALIRARAVMGSNAPIGLLYLIDQLAMRAAEVDIEWIISSARDGERVTPGFERATSWKGAASSNPKGSRFASLAECGARRHATYYLSARSAATVGLRYHGAVTDLLAERLGEEWVGAVEETQESRDIAKATHRMGNWSDTDPMQLYGAIAAWPDYSDATRFAIVNAIPRRKGAVAEFLTAIQSSGVELPSGDVGRALEEKSKEEGMASVDATVEN
jgi:hypothetical protein